MKEIKNMDKSRKKSAVLFACIFVVLGMWMMLSVHCQAAETNNDEKQPQTIRVGSFEDTFNYVDKNGVRRGYGYELMQALAGYTGWKFEYVKCDWSNCFDKLENGEIDIMGDISYTDERAQKMLFPDEPMGEEKYALKQHIAFSYPQWKLIDCDSLDDAADMVIHEKADCFLMGASQALIYDNSQNFKSIPLT